MARSGGEEDGSDAGSDTGSDAGPEAAAGAEPLPLGNFSYRPSDPGIPPPRPAQKYATVLADAGSNRCKLLIPAEHAPSFARRRLAGRVAELDVAYRSTASEVDGILRRNAWRMDSLRACEVERAAARRSTAVRQAAENSAQLVQYARKAVEEGQGPVDARGGESLRAAEKSRLAQALVDSYQLRADPDGFSGRVCGRAAGPPPARSPRAELRRTISSYVSKQRSLDLQLDGPKPRVGGDEAEEKEAFLEMIQGI